MSSQQPHQFPHPILCVCVRLIPGPPNNTSINGTRLTHRRRTQSIGPLLALSFFPFPKEAVCSFHSTLAVCARKKERKKFWGLLSNETLPFGHTHTPQIALCILPHCRYIFYVLSLPLLLALFPPLKRSSCLSQYFDCATCSRSMIIRKSPC